MTRRLTLAALYGLALWFFLGALGLVIALVILLAHLLRVPVKLLWVTSIVLLAAAPLAILAQGLPKGAIVGSDFAARHWVSHFMVALALAFAARAAILEMTKDQDSEPEGTQGPAEERS
jgi:hypothetical protein